jgi:hypothetical protein
MKNLKIFMIVLVMSTSAIFSVSASETEPINQEIRKQLVSLLGNEFPFELKEDQSVEISFIVNIKNEVVIVSVSSEDTNSAIDYYIKQKLNYQSLKVQGIKNDETYIIPLTIKKSS